MHNLRFPTRDTFCYEPNKIYVIGDRKVGKSSLIKRLKGEQIDDEEEDGNKCSLIEHNGITCTRLFFDDYTVTFKDLSDTPNWKYTKILVEELEEVKAVIIVFSLSSETSFEHSKLLIDFLLKNVSNKYMNLILVGNKSDLAVNIANPFRDKVTSYINSIPTLSFIEVSCKRDKEMPELIESLSYIEFDRVLEDDGVNVNKSEKKERRGNHVSCGIL